MRGKALEAITHRSLRETGDWFTRLYDGGRARVEPMISDFLWHRHGTTFAVECKETARSLPLSHFPQMDRMCLFERMVNADAILLVDFHTEKSHTVYMLHPSGMRSWCMANSRKSLTENGADEVGVRVQMIGGISSGTLLIERALADLESREWR